MTPDDVQRLADLARLSVSPAEAKVIADQLGTIIEHMAALEAARDLPVEAGEDGPAGFAGVDLDPAEPPPESASVEPRGLPLDRMAPAWTSGYFTVPRTPAEPTGREA